MKHTILIVDDESVILEQYKQMLELADFNVLTAINGNLAFDIMKENKDEIDLVLLDLMMPGISGTEVLSVMRKEPKVYGDPKVLVLTNLASERTIKECFELGADGYVIKTEMDMEGIVKEVKRVLEEE
ncbi:response regulator [Candidatus Dojkabacteria bacterium]|nr:response regulator [Candidatus Dojkabacteria bacterium]